MTHGQSKEASDWRAEYTYSLGLQAFIYGFPYVYSAQVRYKWAMQQPPNPKVTPYVGAVNRFWHASQVTTADWRDGGSPNNDTLYSLAWVDVTDEPVILSHPDIPDDRYYTFQFSAMHSDNFAYVGRRTTGNQAGNYAIIGSDWEGQLPDDVAALPQSPTSWLLIAGRTLVDGPDDVPNVQAVQGVGRKCPGLSASSCPYSRMSQKRSSRKATFAILHEAVAWSCGQSAFAP